MSGHGHGHGHGHDDHGSSEQNKRIAILISVLALLLSIAETLGKSAQTDALSYNIEASNLWAFYQAKTIRQTSLSTASEAMAVELPRMKEPEVRQAAEKRMANWKSRIDRWESEPETKEGRKELMPRAQAAEQKRDKALKKYHRYEYGSAAFQIAIVLASAAIITGATYMIYMAGGLGLIGIFFTIGGLIVRM